MRKSKKFYITLEVAQCWIDDGFDPTQWDDALLYDKIGGQLIPYATPDEIRVTVKNTK